MSFNSEFFIGAHQVGTGHTPFLIAEISANHNQSLTKALELIEAAAKTGVQAVKLQTYTPDTLTMPGAYTIENPDSLWNGRDLHELYQEAYTPWEWHKELFVRAEELGLICFSSPFDETAVDFLEDLNAPCYKIASFENGHLPLLRKVAKTGKPVIMSTGVTPWEELEESVHCLYEAGCRDLVLLKCTSSYPALPEDANLRAMRTLQERFSCPVGLSDHTLGLAVPLASIALGACVIEKHFTWDRSEGGVDAAFSLEPAEFTQLAEESTRAFRSLGNGTWHLSAKETANRFFRRSIYVAKAVAEGEVVTEAHLKIIRPSQGLHPRHWEDCIGKRAARPLAQGYPLQAGDLI